MLYEKKLKLSICILIRQQCSLFVIESPVGCLREHGSKTAINALDQETTYRVDYGSEDAGVDVLTYHEVVRDAVDGDPRSASSYSRSE